MRKFLLALLALAPMVIAIGCGPETKPSGAAPAAPTGNKPGGSPPAPPPPPPPPK